MIISKSFIRSISLLALIISITGLSEAQAQSKKKPDPAPQQMVSSEFKIRQNGKKQVIYYFQESNEKRSRDKKKPLIIVLHGGTAPMDLAFSQTVAQRYLKVWAPYTEQVVAVAPTTTWGWMVNGMAEVDATIAYAKKNFNIDEDRIFLWGQSMGGHGSWRYAFWEGAKFAGIIPICGGYDFGDTLRNLNNMPIYHIQGQTDDQYSIRPDAVKNAAWFAAQPPGAYDYTFRYLPGGHLLFESEIPAILEWMKNKKRVTDPNEIRLSGMIPTYGWVPSEIAHQKDAQFAPQDLKDLPKRKNYWLDVTALQKSDAAVSTSIDVVRSRDDNGLSYAIQSQNVAAVTIDLLDGISSDDVQVTWNGVPQEVHVTDDSQIEVILSGE